MREYYYLRKTGMCSEGGFIRLRLSNIEQFKNYIGLYLS